MPTTADNPRVLFMQAIALSRYEKTIFFYERNVVIHFDCKCPRRCNVCIFTWQCIPMWYELYFRPYDLLYGIHLSVYLDSITSLNILQANLVVSNLYVSNSLLSWTHLGALSIKIKHTCPLMSRTPDNSNFPESSTQRSSIHQGKFIPNVCIYNNCVTMPQGHAFPFKLIYTKY